MKHTPGPWFWWSEKTGRPKKYDLDKLLAADSRPGFKINDQSCTEILTLYGNGKITPNKRLIAAAPDLAEALEGLYNAIDSCVALTPGVLKAAREALRKAGRA